MERPAYPSLFWLELATMQREVLAWRRLWTSASSLARVAEPGRAAEPPLDPARSLLALHTRHQSGRLLQMAGLVEYKEYVVHTRLGTLYELEG